MALSISVPVDVRSADAEVDVDRLMSFINSETGEAEMEGVSMEGLPHASFLAGMPVQKSRLHWSLEFCRFRVGPWLLNLFCSCSAIPSLGLRIVSSVG